MKEEKLIISIDNLIKEYNCQHFFVLDTTQDGLTNKISYNDGDITYNRYCYETTKYNKLVTNSIFIYRQTKRSSKNRKFYFFGGGIIKDIVSPDNSSSVEALITSGFKFENPIYEDDEALNNVVWTSKHKKTNSWDHFWNQYGMNEITKEEFMSIVKNVTCYNAEMFFKENFILDFIEEDKKVNKKVDLPENFVGIYKKSNGSLKTGERKFRKCNGVHIDFNSLNEKKKTLGTFGELLVVKDELMKLETLGIKKNVEHVALTKGDGLGYDILSFDENGNEMYIEVKTTATNKEDQFYLSKKELEMTELDNYYIYRIYNLDMKQETYNVRIYDKSDIKKLLNPVPVTFKVEFKK